MKHYPLWTALITPLKDDQSVDFESLKTLVEEQCEAGNGLLVLGSTGEALNLSLEERKEILEYVISLKPSSPIMVGVGGSELIQTKQWVQYLEGQNIDAYLMVTPLYAKPGAEGQYLWFKALMDEVSRPVMLYNVPGRTAAPLSFEAVKRLREHPRFWAIKEASGSPEEFRKYKEAAPNGIVFSGDDALTPKFVPHGCEGLVSVASNAWPVQTNQYVQKSLENSLSDDDLKLWDGAVDSLFEASNPVPVKRLLFDQGRIPSPTLKLPLHHTDLKSGTNLEKFNTLIKNWNK